MANIQEAVTNRHRLTARKLSSLFMASILREHEPRRHTLAFCCLKEMGASPSKFWQSIARTPPSYICTLVRCHGKCRPELLFVLFYVKNLSVRRMWFWQRSKSGQLSKTWNRGANQRNIDIICCMKSLLSPVSALSKVMLIMFWTWASWMESTLLISENPSNCWQVDGFKLNWRIGRYSWEVGLAMNRVEQRWATQWVISWALTHGLNSNRS